MSDAAPRSGIQLGWPAMGGEIGGNTNFSLGSSLCCDISWDSSPGSWAVTYLSPSSGPAVGGSAATGRPPAGLPQQQPGPGLVSLHVPVFLEGVQSHTIEIFLTVALLELKFHIFSCL